MSPFDEKNLPQGGIRGEGEIHPERVTNPEVAYDRTDMSARAIVGFLIFLAIAGVIMHLVLWGLYKSFAGSYKLETQISSPIISATRQMLPKGDPERTFPAPRLQVDDVADMNKFRIEEDQTLSSYGWVDQNAGVVRVPIERAMQGLAQQGLPVRPMPPENVQNEIQQTPTPGSDGAMPQQKVGQPAGPPAMGGK